MIEIFNLLNLVDSKFDRESLIQRAGTPVRELDPEEYPSPIVQKTKKTKNVDSNGKPTPGGDASQKGALIDFFEEGDQNEKKPKIRTFYQVNYLRVFQEVS